MNEVHTYKSSTLQYYFLCGVERSALRATILRWRIIIILACCCVVWARDDLLIRFGVAVRDRWQDNRGEAPSFGCHSSSSLEKLSLHACTYSSVQQESGAEVWMHDLPRCIFPPFQAIPRCRAAHCRPMNPTERNGARQYPVQYLQSLFVRFRAAA